MLPVEIPTGDGSVFFFDAGAVILIILAIILVPRLLGGSKKKDTTAPKPAPAAKAKPAAKPASAAMAKTASTVMAKSTAKPAPTPKPAPAVKAKPAPKPTPTPKPKAASAPQAGLFEGAKSFVKEQKETAAAEAAMVLDSPMTRYAADAFVNALQELRPQLAAKATHHDYFVIHVYKDDCDLCYYAYDMRENKYRSGELITRVRFSTIQNLFRWENGYARISSHKAKAELKNFLGHECIVKTGFLLRCSGDRLGVLISQM